MARKPRQHHIPDFGAIVATIREETRRIVHETVEEEARLAQEYVTSFIRGNKASPNPGESWHLGGPPRGSAEYREWKRKHGFDPRHAIRTGKYVDSIKVFPISRGRRTAAIRMKVGFHAAARSATLMSRAPTFRAEEFRPVTARGFGRGRILRTFFRRAGRAGPSSVPLTTLAKWLEVGVPSVGGRTGQVARPHWRPLARWYRNHRAPMVRRKIAREIRKAIRQNHAWRTR